MEMRFSSKKGSSLIKETEKLWEKKVIRESIHEAGKFAVYIFLIPKTPNYLKRILNLKKPNKFLPCMHFDMEAINSILTVIILDVYVVKVDIRNAYYSLFQLWWSIKSVWCLHFMENFISSFAYQMVSLCVKVTKLLKTPLAFLWKITVSMICIINSCLCWWFVYVLPKFYKMGI